MDPSLRNGHRVEIAFGGCGGMYHYLLGVASVLQKHFDLSNVVFSGTSAGCFPAFCLAAGYDVQELFVRWNLPFLKDVRQSYTGGLLRWNNIVRRHTYEWLPQDVSVLHDRLYVWVTEVVDSVFRPSTFRPMLCSRWENREDLLNCLMASAHVPFLEPQLKLTQTFRGRRCIDGGASTHDVFAVGKEESSILLVPSRWRRMRLNWWYCYSSETWAQQLFDWGKQDALHHLHEFNAVLHV
jgi:predicted acylesterase/phospholipase RssA